MIELENDTLRFSFPDVHESAGCEVQFQRTLRIPDDGDTYALPPGLGRFPLRHVDDFASRVPEPWLAHGGVMFPMYQSEAMWIWFGASGEDFPYPVALKVATGKVNAVTGETWEDGLHADSQDYVVLPEQPWLDGYCVEKGLIRQFVAMPLGAGYTVEEQVTGEAAHGGVQLIAYPMKREAYEARRRAWEDEPKPAYLHDAVYCVREAVPLASKGRYDMGLAPGGRMRQEIYDDPFGFDEWDTEHAGRCFVHLVNSLVWRAITEANPPTTPPTAEEYTRAGLPWFEYYADGEALEGSGVLRGLKSVLELGKEKGDVPIPENESVSPEQIVHLRKGLRPGQVREGRI